jgi:hypothetical protein
MWVIEVICRIPEGVHFEFCQEVLGNFLKEPVEDHSAFDAALTVQDEDYLGEFGIVESFLHDSVAIADVLGCVVEVSLDKALEDVEEDAVSFKELNQRSREIRRARERRLTFYCVRQGQGARM